MKYLTEFSVTGDTYEELSAKAAAMYSSLRGSQEDLPSDTEFQISPSSEVSVDMGGDPVKITWEAHVIIRKMGSTFQTS